MKARGGQGKKKIGVRNMFFRGFGGVEFTWRTFFGLIWVESTHIFLKSALLVHIIDDIFYFKF